MKYKHFLLASISLFCLILSTRAVSESTYSRISIKDGLADNSIFSIQEDHDGFIWFGTGYGLSRYDGKIIKNFIPENYSNITRIYDTPEGMLLFIAQNSLNCFDRYREAFVKVRTYNDEKYYTDGIHIINDSLYWSVSKNELHLLKRIITENIKDKTLYISLKIKKRYRLTKDKEYLNNICLSHDKNIIYLTTNRCRLLAFNHKESKIIINRHFKFKGQYPIAPTSLTYDNNYLWISFLGKGVIQYDISLNSYQQYSNLHQKSSLSHNDVYDFIAINNRKFLAATWNGYTIFSPDKEKKNHFYTEIFDKIGYQPYNLETRIISAYYDSQGIIYMGTRGGGVIVSNPEKQFYHKYYQSRNNEICGIIADNQRHIWLGTFSGEILRSKYPFDIEKNLEFESVRKSSAKEEYAILCVCKDKQGNLWFGNSNFSISFYNMKKNEFIDYPIPTKFRDGGNTNYNNYIWSLFIDKQDHFLIGTNKGFLLFNRKTKEFSAPQISETITSVRAITQEKDGTIWLGTSNGLYSLQITDNNKIRLIGNYECQKGIKARYIRSLLSSSDGTLYIGYTTGLGILKNDTISNFYSITDGLCNNFIDCITEDSIGGIWLGTISGISRYNKYQQLFFNYYISTNNKSVALIGKTLFWGNNNALTYFNHDNIISASKVKQPLLLDLELRNKHIEPREDINGQIILEKGLPYTKRITLNHANRDFSLRFRSLSYSEESQKYSYRLLPYQKEYLISDENGKVSYTNLSPGEYVFEVKSIYPEGTDSANSTLNIVISPHWSQTWWLRLYIYIVIIVVVSLSVQRFRKKQKRIQYGLQLEHELVISKMERNNEKQLREERETFFTNVAHELRTPITLVLSPLNGLLSKKKTSDKDYKTLAMISENGNVLQKLVDDLLCVQKIDAGMMKLNISEINIVTIVSDISTSFRQLAETKEIDFKVENTTKSCMLWIDVEKIVSAIRNLLSNAFKYTPKGGSITLAISEVEIDDLEFCQISVTDNGIGIPKELHDKVFDSFITGHIEPAFSTKIGIGLYIVKNTIEMHHGSITLESEPQKGSIFTLYIPKGNEHFINEQHEIDSESTDFSTKEKTNPQPSKEEELLYTYKKHKLLIIEDNQDVRKYIASIFPKKQYTILEAENGQEGIEQAKSNIPDLIISDIMMPVKDGFECWQEIRNDQEIAHIPIIVLTAKSEDTNKIKSAQIRVDDYMMKPFNPEYLKVKVENLLLHREQLKRLYTKALLLKEKPVIEEEKEDIFMQQVINIIEANLTNDSFGVKMLAEQLSMSQPTLYRKIKQRSGLSITEVIRSVRMSRAAALLMEGKYSIQEIAILVGFTDSNTFRKHFIEQFGVPPSKYI